MNDTANNNGKDIVFVVDDSMSSLMTARHALEGDFRVYTFQSAEKMLEMLLIFKPSLIILDLEMYEISGYDVLTVLKGEPDYATLPVIIVTAKTDIVSEIRCMRLGASDYLTKPFIPMRLKNQVHTRIQMNHLSEEIARLKYAEYSRVTQFFEGLTYGAAASLGDSFFDEAVRVRGLITELVAHLQTLSAYQQELKEWNPVFAGASSMVRDIGKSAMDEIIEKKTPLAEDEHSVIRKHPVIGVAMLNKLLAERKDDEDLARAAVFAGSHHENWDGTGYPKRLQNLGIPLEGRILSPVDSYVALTSPRPYRDALTDVNAKKIIISEMGKKFDPDITRHFIAILNGEPTDIIL
ncbi:MAG: response regulator [Oscillospiraceae bacterium]|jgi:putative two-component system response regulator|nr:response regulator [Oscillospiraceae bacterium]